MSYANRIPCLDGLRSLAALAVMLFHFNIFFLPQARVAEIVPFVNKAYLAVDLFFLLSGFVMAHVYGRLLTSNWHMHALLFARARFARIYPLFAVTTLAMAIVFATVAVVSFAVDQTVGLSPGTETEVNAPSLLHPVQLIESLIDAASQ